MTAERGQRLQVNAYGGDVTVRAWNRNAVRVEANTSGRTRVEVVELGRPSVSVRTQGRHGPPTEVDLRISVPSGWP